MPPKRPARLLRLLHEIRVELAAQHKSRCLQFSDDFIKAISLVFRMNDALHLLAITICLIGCFGGKLVDRMCGLHSRDRMRL